LRTFTPNAETSNNGMQPSIWIFFNWNLYMQIKFVCLLPFTQ
jgi:hypothetical protein